MKKRLFFFGLLLIGLAGCKNNDDDIRFRALDEGLMRYGRSITNYNSLIRNDLEAKLRDWNIAYRAAKWPPKMEYVTKATDSVILYIESLTTSLCKEAGVTWNSEGEITSEKNKDGVATIFENQSYTDTLFYKLIAFDEKILSVLNPDEFKDNPILVNYIKKSKDRFRKKFPIHSREELTSYFREASNVAALTMLHKLKNDVAIAANDVLDYINGMNSMIVEDYTRFSTIVSQNSSHLKAGETLEIYAGMGSFTTASSPKITIDGKKIVLDANGVADYKIRASNKPGKYSIPVKIVFMSPKALPDSSSKDINYTVEP